jgi:alpha-ribazole phosphatase
MSPTRFWLVRHAPVAEAARAILYGTMDVELCRASLAEAAPLCRTLAARLPHPAAWVVSPLSRTRLTAEAIFAAGYPEAEAAPLCRTLAARLPHPAAWVVSPLSRTRLTAEAIFAAGYPDAEAAVEPAMIEQSLGEWQGLAHAELPDRLSRPAHAFWPLGGAERPPGGESMADVITRVGESLERLARHHAGGDVVVVSHGGAIRAAVAHALGVHAEAALTLSVQNLSLTRLERHPHAWRVVSVNELPEELRHGFG